MPSKRRSKISKCLSGLDSHSAAHRGNDSSLTKNPLYPKNSCLNAKPQTNAPRRIHHRKRHPNVVRGTRDMPSGMVRRSLPDNRQRSCARPCCGRTQSSCSCLPSVPSVSLCFQFLCRCQSLDASTRCDSAPRCLGDYPKGSK